MLFTDFQSITKFFPTNALIHESFSTLKVSATALIIMMIKVIIYSLILLPLTSSGNKYGERPELEQLLRQHIQQEISSDATVGKQWQYHPHVVNLYIITGGTKTKTSIDWPPLPPSDVLLKVNNVI